MFFFGRITSLQQKLLADTTWNKTFKGDSFNNGHRKDSSTLGKVPEGSSSFAFHGKNFHSLAMHCRFFFRRFYWYVCFFATT